ncbi:MAG: hypothetical protein CVV27_14360 [Candidatus Melainabacteria bacterium HGW-Melainabacteria-1]|nr:MAG: hypothetical protein CVV27_14360 [Candidatus Melainabacteria bacterium HGW-Melainabacteria-1]
MKPSVQDDVTTLAYLGWVLQNAGFETHLIAANELANQAFEQLLVHYGTDAQGRELVIRLLFMEELVQSYQQESGQSLPASYGTHLQFLINFATPGLDGRQPDLDRLLATLNRLSPLGLFGTHQQDGLFYRYTLVLNRKEPDPRLIAEIIESTGFIAERFMPAFDRLGAGEPVQNILASLEPKGS